MKTKLNILVIATGKAKLLCDTIAQRGHTYTLAHPSDFDLYLSANTNGHDRVYLDGERLIANKYDAVITRIGEHRPFAEKLLFHLQHNLSLFCVQSGSSIQTCADKFKCAQIMSAKRLRIPRQIYSMTGKYPVLYVKNLGGLPMILKENSGSKGKGLIILESPMQTNMTLESFYGSDRKIILQEYLNNGGSDERHIVCGDKIVNSMRRHAPKNDIRANLSLAGSGEKISPDEATKDFVLKICAAIPGLNFAGVDIMKVKDQEGKEINYFIEVNSNPGEKIINITGHNHYEDLVKFVEDNYRKKQTNNVAAANTNTTSATIISTVELASDTMPETTAARHSITPPVYDRSLSPEENKQIYDTWCITGKITKPNPKGMPGYDSSLSPAENARILKEWKRNNLRPEYDLSLSPEENARRLDKWKMDHPD